MTYAVHEFSQGGSFCHPEDDHTNSVCPKSYGSLENPKETLEFAARQLLVVTLEPSNSLLSNPSVELR
jgi:hypothetical protein